jgi:hypothetical protein
MRMVCILVAVLAAVTSRVPVSAQMDEGLVKAAALLKVGLFVEWPVAPVADRFVIGVAADEDFSQKVIAASRGRRLQDRDVVVQRLGDGDEACACQMLFVGNGDDVRATTLLRWAHAKPVLTIGETTAFLREGGIVRVFRSDDRLRLQINQKGAKDAGLKVISRLLQLAYHSP